ncbi:hypothetical protein [Candidatus Liberibacter asiaticus]|uniref:hypothetical protein n=1 Tax=Liberibacter asiaticus TaxID=34021 RepID=UPI0012ED4577|nr:hypothetical protein [Candidatus Liberibacter asiaticus]
MSFESIHAMNREIFRTRLPHHKDPNTALYREKSHWTGLVSATRRNLDLHFNKIVQ